MPGCVRKNGHLPASHPGLYGSTPFAMAGDCAEYKAMALERRHTTPHFPTGFRELFVRHSMQGLRKSMPDCNADHSHERKPISLLQSAWHRNQVPRCAQKSGVTRAFVPGISRHLFEIDCVRRSRALERSPAKKTITNTLALPRPSYSAPVTKP